MWRKMTKREREAIQEMVIASLQGLALILAVADVALYLGSSILAP